MSTPDLTVRALAIRERAAALGVPDVAISRPVDEILADVHAALGRNKRKSPDHYLAFPLYTEAEVGWITLCVRYDPVLNAPDDHRLASLDGKAGGWMAGLAGCAPGDVYVPKVGRRLARAAMEAKLPRGASYLHMPNGTPPWHELAYSIVCNHLDGYSDPDDYVVRLPSWAWPRQSHQRQLREAVHLYDTICAFANAVNRP